MEVDASQPPVRAAGMGGAMAGRRRRNIYTHGLARRFYLLPSGCIRLILALQLALREAGKRVSCNDTRHAYGVCTVLPRVTEIIRPTAGPPRSIIEGQSQVPVKLPGVIAVRLNM